MPEEGRIQILFFVVVDKFVFRYRLLASAYDNYQLVSLASGSVCFCLSVSGIISSKSPSSQQSIILILGKVFSDLASPRE